MKVKFKKLKENAIMPSYNGETDAGIDLFACEDGDIFPGETVMVSTGIAWEPDSVIPFKALFKLEGRSGLAKDGFDVFGGVVDQDYRGEIKVVIHNTTNKTFRYQRGHKIAQGIVHLIPIVEIEEVEIISDTDRGSSGFGSSGK